MGQLARSGGGETSLEVGLEENQVTSCSGCGPCLLLQPQGFCSMSTGETLQGLRQRVTFPESPYFWGE